jgi:hypothetical protein
MSMSRKSVAVIIALWTVCVLPFTVLGYGSDADAWLVARAAGDIWNTARYVASRSTGFPLFELLEAPLVQYGGWQWSNLLATAGGASLLAALLFLVSKKRLRHPFFVVAGIAWLPVVIKNASSTMDYLPGLALLVWAYAMLLERRHLACAVLIGLACGFRPTNGLYLLPCLLWHFADGRGAKPAAQMILLALCTGTAAFSPALLAYGLKTSYAVMDFDLKTRAMLAGYNALQLFGAIGWIVLAAAAVAGMLRRRSSSARSISRPFLLFHAGVIALWLALFAMLPDEAEYLLPAVPSIILLADALVTRKAAVLAVVALLSYHAVRVETLAGESGMRRVALSIRQGYTGADIDDRVFKLSVRAAATECAISQPTVLMYGALWIPVDNAAWTWDPPLRMHRRQDGMLFLSDKILDAGRLRALHAQGYRLAVWTADKWEYYRADVPDWRASVDVLADLSAFFGRPLQGMPLSMK